METTALSPQAFVDEMRRLQADLLSHLAPDATLVPDDPGWLEACKQMVDPFVALASIAAVTERLLASGYPCIMFNRRLRSGRGEGRARARTVDGRAQPALWLASLVFVKLGEGGEWARAAAITPAPEGPATRQPSLRSIGHPRLVGPWWIPRP